MTWQTDAELAGTLYKKAKPYTAMLIARCVEPDHGSGKRPEMDTSKTSQRSFADHAGIAPTTVGKYLRTWDAMATAGLVPTRGELTPGTDVDLPDMKQWKDYYREANPTKSKPEKDNAPLPKPDQVTEQELGEPVDIEPTRIVGRYVVRMSQSVKSSKIEDRKSTRLNSSHVKNSYAAFGLKKKKHT